MNRPNMFLQVPDSLTRADVRELAKAYNIKLLGFKPAPFLGFCAIIPWDVADATELHAAMQRRA